MKGGEHMKQTAIDGGSPDNADPGRFVIVPPFDLISQ
jgi:hypothetical protein